MNKIIDIVLDFLNLLKTGYVERKEKSYLIFFISVLLFTINSITWKIIFTTISYTYAKENNIILYNTTTMEKNSLISIYLNISLIPLIEELSTRYPLKKKLLGSSLFFSILFFVNSSIQSFLHFPIRVLVAFFIGFFFYIISKYPIIDRLTNTFYKHPLIVLYFFSFVFSVMHIFQFKITISLLPILPFLLIPYLIDGLMYSYVRLRFSTNHSVVLHILNNILASLPILITLYVT
jgi:hypothetical protein